MLLLIFLHYNLSCALTLFSFPYPFSFPSSVFWMTLFSSTNQGYNLKGCNDKQWQFYWKVDTFWILSQNIPQTHGRNGHFLFSSLMKLIYSLLHGYIALGPHLVQSLLCIDLMWNFLESECMLSCIWFFTTLWTVAHQAPLSMGFFRQEYWSGLPFPSPGDLLDRVIELASPESPALADKFFTTDSLPGATWEGPGKWVCKIRFQRGYCK